MGSEKVLNLWKQLTLVVALILASLSIVGASPDQPSLQFPTKGISYVQARAMLFKQGLRIAPDRPSKPDQTFGELDCPTSFFRHACRALFLEKKPDGWRNYVVVYVNQSDKTVISANYPTTVEGMLSIPPPLSANVPQIKGSYLVARERLRELGFRPARRIGEHSRICVDIGCRHQIVLPEAECSGTGASFCNAYWIAKNGRVLDVVTVGEVHPGVYFVRWTTPKELREFIRH
jgi:hypothetical protein